MIPTGNFEPTVQKLNIIPAYMLVKRERRDSSCLINLECRYRKLSPPLQVWDFYYDVLSGSFNDNSGLTDNRFGIVVRAIKKFSKILSIQNICPYFQLTRKTILHRYWVTEKKHNPTSNHKWFKFISTQHLISCCRLGAKRHMACYQQQKQ